MTFKTRIPLIQNLEKLRGSRVICYLTSIRPNINAVMSEDAVREFFDQVGLLGSSKIPKLDIFLCSNGGNGTVPWRLISLLREHADEIGVIIPYRAYSAATLVALGANEIVMHRYAELGPIDPTVTNEYNPVDPQTNRRIGISVEDVKAYISFIKTTVGIHHEDELVKTMEILAQKVHPLALGNVERFLAQSRLIAGKILRTHMADGDGHKIDEIIETMASKLYFHGHPINRDEASKELGLKVAQKVSAGLEKAIWDLYLDFETELQNRKIFDAVGELFAAASAQQAAHQAAAQQAAAAAQQPAGAIAQQPGLINLGAPVQLPGSATLLPGTSFSTELVMAVVESAQLSSSFRMSKRFVVAGYNQVGEPMIRDETLAQGWEQIVAPPPARTELQKSSKRQAARAPAKAPRAQKG